MSIPITSKVGSFINNVRPLSTPSTASTPATSAAASIYGNDQKVASPVSNYQSKISSINDWSKSITDQTRASALAKKAAKEAAVQLKQQQTQSRAKLGSTGTRLVSKSEASTYTGPLSGRRAQIVSSAKSLLGTPYAWGGGGYGNRGSHGIGKGTENVIGVDCSGLTSYAYSTVGIRLPRTARGQLTSGYKTDISNLQPGDLVVWKSGGHTSIYIGNGQIIESPNVGKTVRIRTLGKNEPVVGVRLNLDGA